MHSFSIELFIIILVLYVYYYCIYAVGIPSSCPFNLNRMHCIYGLFFFNFGGKYFQLDLSLTMWLINYTGELITDLYP